MIKLFEGKIDCCGCAACMNICPKKAITMKTDSDGFDFPEINNDLCIECGLCKKVCAFQNVSVPDTKPLATYVAINKKKDVLINSASGGIFAALAFLVFEKNGVVFGCAYNDNMKPEHVCVDNSMDIKKIQGSKYVQSNINTSYSEVKKHLDNGRWVLFTGTPCQIAGLKSFLGKDYNNLITADLICHGVPGTAFFEGYIKYLGEKLKGKVIDFKFRDKSKGWGLIRKRLYNGKVVYKKNNKILEKSVPTITSYYYRYFLKGDIYRENCYECKYACSGRVGDFTIGDYWGIEKAHPEIETKNGVSVLLVNSQKGIELIEDLKKYLDLTKSTFELARKQNGQLNRPTAKGNKREEILRTWRDGGYHAVAKEYYRVNKIAIWKSKIKMMLPLSVRKFLKGLIKRKNNVGRRY